MEITAEARITRLVPNLRLTKPVNGIQTAAATI